MQISDKFVDFVGTLLTTRAVADSTDLASRLKVTIFNDYLKSELQTRLAQNGGKHKTAVMLSMCMVVAANHRTSFELLLGTRDYVVTNVFGPQQHQDVADDQSMLCFTTFNGWLKQEGSKVLKKFIEETMMTSDADDDEAALKINYALASLQQGLWNYLARHVRSYTSGDEKKESEEEVVGVLAELPGYPHVAIHECSAAPVIAAGGGCDGDEEEVDAVKEGWLTLSSDLRSGIASLEPFSELLRIPGTQLFHIGTVKRFSRWMRLLSGTTTTACSTSSQCCDKGCEATPSPTSQYPKVQKAISEAISDDESRLLLSFVFEGKRDVAIKRALAAILSEDHQQQSTTTSTTLSSSSSCDVDHFSFLLSRIPLWYPTVPTHWSPMDYMMLTGTDLAEVVPQKKDQLSSFVCGVKGALFSALRIPSLVNSELTTTIPTLTSPLGELHSDILKYLAPELSAAVVSSSSTTLLGLFLHELFSEAHVQWARATFDSRAFNLNFDGEVRLVLAPVIDMVNHNGDRSDILVRRVDPVTQDFVIENGAALPPPQTAHSTPTSSSTVVTVQPQELFMSYGPLQNWELLLSYGFAFNPLQQQPIATTTTTTDREDQEMLLRRKLLIGNAYDRVPLPLDLSGEDDATDEESLSFVARRKVIIEKACLQVGQGVWVGPPVQLHSLPKESLDALRQSVINSKKSGGNAPSSSAEDADVDILGSIPSIAPYPAVLATLRLTHSQIEEFPSLEANPFEAVSDETEATMVATLSAVLRSIILSFYNPSIVETVGILKSAAADAAATVVVVKTATTKDDDEEEEDGELPVNEALSYYVNLPLLAMAHGCLRWCCEQSGEDFKTVVEETLKQLNYDDDDDNSDDDSERL